MKRCLVTLLLIVFMIMSFVVAGCATAEKPVPEPQDLTDELKEGEIEETTEPEEVTFITSDGITIHGHLFGKGETGIILAHMYPSDQSSWYNIAVILAAKGYRALTFDFRGYGNSEGEKDIAVIDRDVEAAWDFIEKQGIDKVFLIGASMGGTATLKVTGQRPAAGVVALSAPLSFRGLSAADEVAQITAPKLFLASEGDSADVASAQEFFALAREPKGIKIFPGSAHGTDMLEGEQGLEVLKSILEFVDRENGS